MKYNEWAKGDIVKPENYVYFMGRKLSCEAQVLEPMDDGNYIQVKFESGEIEKWLISNFIFVRRPSATASFGGKKVGELAQPEIKIGDTVRVPDSLPSNICHSDWFGKTGTAKSIGVDGRINFDVQDGGHTHHLKLLPQYLILVQGEIQEELHAPKSTGDFKIECKPICWCCSKQYAPNAEKDEDFIYHDDPCEFSHLEREMLPMAKSLFRRDMLAREKSYDAAIERRERIDGLALAENVLSGHRMNGAKINPAWGSIRSYIEKTGSKPTE